MDLGLSQRKLAKALGVDKNLWSAGLGADLGVLMLGPVRVFPRLSPGANYRNADPDQSWGAVGSLGLGTAVWLGHRWQAVVAADRDFDFGAPDSSRETGVPDSRVSSVLEQPGT
jgi:hypothetical protein